MPSQKASTASARPSAATAGIIWVQTRLDVSVCACGLGRHGVSAQKGGHDRHRAPSCQGTRGAQLLALGVEVETVA